MDDILVDIVSRLPEDQKQGKFGVATSEKNTVVGLIRKLCKEHRIPMKTSYVLRDSHERVLQWSQTLLQCGVRHGAVLYLCNEDEDVQTAGGCDFNTWWFVAAISLLIGGVGITAVSVMLSKNGTPIYKYGIVMDAGSSHTKLFVYKWDGAKLHDTALARQIDSCQVKGQGLTSYTDNITALSAPLLACLEAAKKKVPTERHKTTPIFLGATAGMRMLNETDFNTSSKILQEVRRTIKMSPFQFTSEVQQARIISGEEEGTFGWVTANYLGGNFGVKRPGPFGLTVSGEATVGALDMGGASTQITFYTPATLPPGYKSDLDLYGSNYTVYTHSYLCYGINEALRQFQAILVKEQGMNSTDITNPCGPRGSLVRKSFSDVFEAPCSKQFAGDLEMSFDDIADKNTIYEFRGTSNTSSCQDNVRKLFNFTETGPYSPFSFNGKFQPPVFGKFLAFSSFYYEMDFLNLTQDDQSISLQRYTSSLTSLCGKEWAEVKTMKHSGPSDMLPWYCFEGQYILTLLTEGYKFNNDSWKNIQFVNKVDNTEVGWSLGFMLNSSTLIPPEGPESYISITLFGVLTALFGVFILLAVAFACYARKYQRKKDGVYERVPAYGAV